MRGEKNIESIDRRQRVSLSRLLSRPGRILNRRLRLPFFDEERCDLLLLSGPDSLGNEDPQPNALEECYLDHG